MILLGIGLVVLSYREVVSVYTRAGGSYVVARENFGPRIAQVAAVALMVDYVVTVAVQTAAGSAAILLTFPGLARPLGGTMTLLLIAVTATLVMCYVNLLHRQQQCERRQAEERQQFVEDQLGAVVRGGDPVTRQHTPPERLRQPLNPQLLVDQRRAKQAALD